MSGSITSRMTASNALRLERGEPVEAAKAALDGKPGRAQIVRQHGGEALIVVDDEKPLRHDAPDRMGLSKPSRPRRQEAPNIGPPCRPPPHGPIIGP